MMIDYLKSDLAARAKKNPGYSLRAYAKALKIDSSTLSALLNGKRQLTLKTARNILNEINADPTIRQILLSSLSDGKSANNEKFTSLSDDEIEALVGWEHLAILSLLETKNCKQSLNGMASQLGISSSMVMNALSRLQKLGLVYKENGKWKCTGKQFATQTDVPNSALRQAHLQYIEKAAYSLEHHSVDERDITGITMAIAPDKLPQAKKLIRDFRRNLCQYLEAGDKESVYRLNVQLFPLKK